MKLWRYGRAIERLGLRYRLDGVLGSGGMADVCLAWDEHARREVAIKVIKPDGLDQRTLDRFLKEASQVARWRHPNIVRIFGDAHLELLDAAHGSVVPYIVMEYAQGGDLQKRLTPGTPCDLADLLPIFAQLCSAVSYAHAQGVIHRDLKPLNILFRQLDNGAEVVALSDFGLAVEMDATHFTFAGGGTLPYMAPEQLHGKAEAASDIFALGVILYLLCTGRLPFRRTLQDLRRRDPLPAPVLPGDLNPALPVALDAVILQALAEDPAARYADAALLWRAVRGVIASDPDYNYLLAELGGSTLRMPTNPMSGDISDSQPRRASRSYPPVAPVSGAPVLSSFPVSDAPGLASDAADELPISSPVPRRATFPHNIDSYQSSKRNNREYRDVRTNGPDTGDYAVGNVSHAVEADDVYTAIPARSRATGQSQPGGPTSAPQRVQRPQVYKQPARAPRGRMLLFALLLLLLLVLVGASGMLAWVWPGFLLTDTATVTITPASQSEQASYSVQGVTTPPNPDQLQFSLHQLAFTADANPKNVNATGHMQSAGVQAKGMLTFSNGTFVAQRVLSGTVIAGKDGVQVVNDIDVNIPPDDGNTGTVGTVDVSAHAVNFGLKGNIVALDINQSCCGAGGVNFVRNLTPFTGGQDGKNYMFLQQSDVDGYVNAVRGDLLWQAQDGLRQKVAVGEQLLGDMQCAAPAVQADQPLGDQGQNVTAANVSVSQTCAGLSYNSNDLRTIVERQLQQQARGALGANYALVGALQVHVTGVTADNIKADAQGQLAGTRTVQVAAQGVWVYQADQGQQLAWARLIMGQPIGQAQATLKAQKGIAAISISARGATLPGDASKIKIVLATVPPGG